MLFLFLALVTVEGTRQPIRPLEIYRGEEKIFNLSDYVKLPKSCTVKVVPHVTDFIGIVRPRVSSCGHNLTYTHFGSEKSQTLRFFILHGGAHVERAYVRVKKPTPSAFSLRPLRVSQPGGSASLEENLPGGNWRARNCLILVQKMPRHGALVTRRPGVLEYPCSHLKGSVTYRHFAGGHPFDSATLRVTLFHPKRVHYIQLSIFVDGGVNRPPHPSPHPSSELLWNARVEDDSTPSGALLFRPVTLPRGATLVSPFFANDDANRPLEYFYQADLTTGQVMIEATSNFNGTAVLQVMDEDSSKYSIEVLMTCLDFNLYSLFVKAACKGFLVKGGSTAPLNNFPRVENPSNYKFTLIGGPHLGELTIKGNSVTKFTLQDLISGRVVYKNTKFGHLDHLLLQLDRVGTFPFPIYVVPDDKSPPLLGRPKEIVASKNEVSLSPLTVIDPDSTPDEIKYYLESSKFGKIYIRRNNDVEDESNNWTQTDLEQGRVTYKIIKRPIGGGVDVLKLRLMDSAVPSNVSPLQHLHIRILRDSEPPKLVSNDPLHASPTGATLVTGLKAVDLWSPGHLIYTVSPIGVGLFTDSADGSPLSSFSQTMVDSNRVAYKPPAGRESAYIDVPFSVSDADGNVLKDQEQEVGVLRVSEGGTVEITEESLGVDDDPDLDFIVEDNPKMGKILVGDEPSNHFNTSGLFLGEIYYEHDAEEIGRFKVTDWFSVRVANSSRVIRVKVIVNPVDDFPPILDVRKPLAVKEGSRVKVTTDHLQIQDEDTDEGDVSCDITQSPIFGKISPFTYRNLLEGKVEYSQTIHSGIEPSEDSFTVTCHDTSPFRKDFGKIHVSIIPINDEPPILKIQNITSTFAPLTKFISICDLDTPNEQITLGILRQPNKGIISKKYGSISNFSSLELPEVFYESFSSGSVDSFIIAASDGQFTSLDQVWIENRPDDFSPLLVNKGLEVTMYGSVVVSKDQLYSEATDTTPRQLKYVLKDAPMFGVLSFNSTELEPGDSFTQEDVNLKRLLYKHNDNASLMDVIVLDVTDDHRTLLNQNVFITIRDNKTNLFVESESPTIHPKTSLVVNDQLLRVTPTVPFEDKTKIEFHVMSQTKQGRLERRDDPGTSIRLFTGKDLESNAIQYVHTSGLPGLEIIQFEVTNGRTQVFHTLTIKVQELATSSTAAVKLTSVTNKPLTTLSEMNGVIEGAITDEILSSEGDFNGSTAFIVTIPPRHGRIVNKRTNSTVTTFTQGDVNNRVVYYYLDEGDEHYNDSFTFDVRVADKLSVKNEKFIIEWCWISFKSNLFVAEETNNGTLNVELVRKGSLTSSVIVELEIQGGNATAEDFKASDLQVEFRTGQSERSIGFRFKNDDIHEGLETVIVGFKKVHNALIHAPSRATLFILDDDDVISDTTTYQDETSTENLSVVSKGSVQCPDSNATFEFSQSTYEAFEEDKFITVQINRNGDSSKSKSTLLCFTEENTATSDDFVPQAKNESSAVVFLPGEIRKTCQIQLKDDEAFEGDEEFFVHLTCATGSSSRGEKTTAKVVITDNEDEEVVLFKEDHFFAREPLSSKSSILIVPIIRKGETSYGRHVKIIAEDGTAKSGEDFLFKTTVLAFEPKSNEKHVEIEILSDSVVEMRESFNLKLEMVGGKKENHQTIVYISDAPQAAGLMFPSPPLVVSLRDYNQTVNASKTLPQGIPLICVSVCDKHHKHHSRFDSWCSTHGVKPDTTAYTWQMEDLDGEMNYIENPLFFTKKSKMILDSVYFRGGFKIRCGVQPDFNGSLGKTSFSQVAVISKTRGLCPPPKKNMIGAEPFMAHVVYVDESNSKGLKLTVSLPHYDGLFPAISTHRINNPSDAFGSFPMRATVHKCSNLITDSEMKTKVGFLGRTKSNRFREPFETSNLRGIDSLQVYDHLDAKSCMWHFEALYSLPEAINLCGATVRSEASNENDEASVLLELPLFVTYLTTSLLGWQHIDSSTVLRIKFTYRTSTIIKGDMMSELEEKAEGHLLATSMFISTNGSLVVHFKTKPKFHGYYLQESPGQRASRVINVDRPELQLTLTLLGNLTEGSASVEQFWMFSSDYASVDYSGKYEISLIPCVLPYPGSTCSFAEPTVHSLEVQFQQVTDPVLEKYSLDTEFKLKKKRNAPGDDSDESIFEPGDFVYGLIYMVPPQDHLALDIRKCYVCAGRNGHVPRFDPSSKEFGCLMDSPDLQYNLKLIDRDNGETVQKSFYNQLFNASLTKGDCLKSGRLDSKNCDAFVFDVTPLFNQPLTKIWYVHCTYSITITKNTRTKRHTPTIEVKSGTNMHQLILKSSYPESKIERTELAMPLDHDMYGWYWASSVAGLAVSLFVSCILLSFILKVRSEMKEKASGRYSYVSYANCKESEM